MDNKIKELRKGVGLPFLREKRRIINTKSKLKPEPESFKFKSGVKYI